MLQPEACASCLVLSEIAYAEPPQYKESDASSENREDDFTGSDDDFLCFYDE